MRLPPALRIVAGLFIVSGTFAIVRTVPDLLANHVHVDSDLFDVLIGIGLLRLRAASLWWAKFSLGLRLLSLSVMTVVVTFGGGPLNLRVGGWTPTTPALAYSTFAVLVVMAQWQWRVLKRPDVLRLFDDAEQARLLGEPTGTFPTS